MTSKFGDFFDSLKRARFYNVPFKNFPVYILWEILR